MKAFITSLLAILCVALVIGGNMHWNNKIEETVKELPAAASEDNGEKKAPAKKAKDDSKKQDSQKKYNEDDKISSLLAYTANWPDEAARKFEKTLQNGERYKIVFAGSESVGAGENDWPALVQEKLIGTYGKSAFSFEVFSHSLSSNQFLDQGKEQELAEAGADMIILEPFTLNDNGILTIEMSEKNIDAIVEAVKAKNKDAVIILQPPHPLYNASYYGTQVTSLEAYANNHGMAFINHWEAWPERDSKDINDYLSEDRETPNEDGHKLWAEYVNQYLIAE